jgi:hypothetical protein
MARRPGGPGRNPREVLEAAAPLLAEWQRAQALADEAALRAMQARNDYTTALLGATVRLNEGKYKGMIALVVRVGPVSKNTTTGAAGVMYLYLSVEPCRNPGMKKRALTMTTVTGCGTTWEVC